MIIRPATPEDIAEAIRSLPEFTHKNTSQKIAAKVAGRSHKLSLAVVDGEVAGFLVTYALNERVYYNWVMGVLPRYRRTGIAQLLMQTFADSAQNAGCQTLRVKTMNKYRSMLRLLVDHDYNITAIEGEMIVFEKALGVAR